MAKSLSESRFYMWRAVVAMVHADEVVTPHEVSFINDYVQEIPFSKEQLVILGEDLYKPQQAYEMFLKVTEVEDKKDFFTLARAVSWCDGNYALQEKIIIEHLEREHLLDKNQKILQDSRDILNEVELCHNQWKFKTERSRHLFDFLKIFKLRKA